MALTAGQLSYWRHKTGNPHLTMAQALAFHNAMTKATGGAAPAPTVQTPNPPATPFLSVDQLQQQSDTQLSHDQQVQALNDQYAQAMLNSKYQQQAIEKARAQGVSGAQDNAAARGTFHSSIKDGQIYDINAQAANQQQQLQDQLNALNLSTASQVNLLDETLRRSNSAFNDMAVENAAAIDTGYTTTTNPAADGGKPPMPVSPHAPVATGGARQAPAPKPAVPNHNYGLYQSGFGAFKKSRGGSSKIIHIH